MRPRLKLELLTGLTFAVALSAQAQLSLQTAVDLALSHSPKVKIAGDDIAKSKGSIAEVKSAYIPAINIGGGYGDSFGYSNNLPTFFAFQTQSLVFNYSQLDYIRSARSGLDAAMLALREARTNVIEETTLAFLAVQRDERREAVLKDLDQHAKQLVIIVQDRFDAGRDSRLEVHTARLTAAQMRLRALNAATDTHDDLATLSALTGVPLGLLQVSGDFPAVPLVDALAAPVQSPGIAAAFATARSKQQQAWGDARYLYRPQISVIFQYNRYATFTDSFKQIEKAYGQQIGANQEDFALQFNLPLFDKTHQAKARESAADAAHAFHDAQNMQMVFDEGQAKLGHSVDLLRARVDVATEERALAQDQLDVILAQLDVPPAAGAPQLTPKDEQNARIAERDKYLNVVESDFTLRQTEIKMLRQSGGLEDWVRKPPPSPALPAAVLPGEPIPVPAPQP